MRKLRLDPEELTVESFATEQVRSLHGTVRGAQDGVDGFGKEGEIAEPEPDTGTIIITPPSWTCFTGCNQLTCKLSCAGTCYYDRTCNSCQITTCPTGASPECCA